jgi:hypothetical protein
VFTARYELYVYVVQITTQCVYCEYSYTSTPLIYVHALLWENSEIRSQVWSTRGGKRLVGRATRRWEHNFKIHLK